MLAATTKEIHDSLGPLGIDQISYPIQGLEASLEYTMACVRENFRLNPVFTMPLWRRVGFTGGVNIGKHHIPQGVSFLANIQYYASKLISL
jgi:benzoate 4-monooxygenase